MGRPKVNLAVVAESGLYFVQEDEDVFDYGELGPMILAVAVAASCLGYMLAAQS